jgi:hypothetical protein
MSKYDDSAAKLEGWAVFECDDGFFRIQRLDCPKDSVESLPHEPIFNSDNEAIIHVAKKALEGSENHKIAVNLHGTPIQEDSPNILIKDHVLTVRITKPDGELLEEIKLYDHEPGHDPIAFSHQVAQEIRDTFITENDL